MKFLRRGPDPNDPIRTSIVTWLLSRPLMMALDTSRSLRLRKATPGGVVYQDFSPDTRMDPALQ